MNAVNSPQGSHTVRGRVRCARRGRVRRGAAGARRVERARRPMQRGVPGPVCGAATAPQPRKPAAKTQPHAQARKNACLRTVILWHMWWPLLCGFPHLLCARAVYPMLEMEEHSAATLLRRRPRCAGAEPSAREERAPMRNGPPESLNTWLFAFVCVCGCRDARRHAMRAKCLCSQAARPT